MSSSAGSVFNPNFFGQDREVFRQRTVSGTSETGSNPVYSFEMGSYLATKGFNAELSRLQNELVNKGTVELPTGEKLGLSSVGDLLGLKLYMDQLESARSALRRLGQKGLDAQGTSLTSHRS